jgi:glycosyltransferase involved in cell wall biosynthesis
MRFSYIIAYKHNSERLENLKRVVDWVKSLGDIELILVEQDDSPKLPELVNIDFKYKFIENKLPFNKSWAFNIGWKMSTSDIIVFGDSDLIMSDKEFLDAIQELNEYEVVNPYNKVIDLFSEESRMNLEELSKIEREFRGEKDIQKTPIAGGIIAFKSDSLEKVGGWCEEFIGWGGEDDFQSLKIKMFLKWKEFDNRCYHLFHTRVTPYKEFYFRNLNILNQLGSLNALQMRNYIDSTKDTIADEDKLKNLIKNK